MSELMLALEQIEKEKGISKEIIIDAIEKSLLDACKKDFGKSENVTVNMDRETGAIEVYAAKTVVDQVEDPATEISLEKALMISSKYAVGDVVNVEITPKNFGRIAAQQARSVIVQTIKEEEKNALYDHFYCKEKDVVTGIVQRYVGKNISVSLDDKMDALLMENEQVKTEHYRPTDRIKLYIVEVKKTSKGPKVIVSRTHPELVKRLFEKSLLDACKKDFGKSENVTVNMDRETGAIEVYAAKTVVDQVEDPATEISLEKALMISSKYAVGDVVNVEITPKNFGRIAAQQARSVIVQTIKEEEKNALYDHFYCKEKDVVTGIVQRYVGKNISVSLDDKMDALLMENEQVKTEHYRPTDRIKLYIVEVKKTSKGPKVIVSRTHPELVKRLFEKEVTEVADGTVEIKSISREAGSRSKIAVWSNDPNVDPVGACVGMNGTRVNNIVEDLKGEKIDIITWSEDPARFIENALSPSKVVSVQVDEEDKSARVVVPDYQLSLAIGKEGQNARLAARLTGYKIDIKSESQAREAYGYEDSYDEEYDDNYDEYESYDEDENMENGEYTEGNEDA